MRESQRDMLLAILVVILAFLTLGGLGNAAYSVSGFYWIPFVLNIPLYAVVAWRLFRGGEKKAEGEKKEVTAPDYDKIKITKK